MHQGDWTAENLQRQHYRRRSQRNDRSRRVHFVSVRTFGRECCLPRGWLRGRWHCCDSGPTQLPQAVLALPPGRPRCCDQPSEQAWLHCLRAHEDGPYLGSQRDPRRHHVLRQDGGRVGRQEHRLHVAAGLRRWPLLPSGVGRHEGDHSHHFWRHERFEAPRILRQLGALQRHLDCWWRFLRPQGRSEVWCHLLPPGGGGLGELEGRQVRKRAAQRGCDRVCEDSRGIEGCFPDLPERCRSDLPWLEGEARIHWRVQPASLWLQLEEEASGRCFRRPSDHCRSWHQRISAAAAGCLSWRNTGSGCRRNAGYWQRQDCHQWLRTNRTKRVPMLAAARQQAF
mmetsp:Transcript_78150/g.171344  ORF Transcript_78150/g.171344 Transcript_78150/m.171344 type:complete len:340 (-) Transcript_78150:1245-2264(-)